MPTFHNPVGSMMPEDARRRLAALASSAEAPLIEDDTLVELSLVDRSLPPVGSFASGKAPVITKGSTSKLFWGGLRVGWIRAPRSMIAQVARIKAAADLGTSTLSQAIAERLLARVDEVRAIRRRQLRERCALLSHLLDWHLPRWQWRPPAGGLCIWPRLPVGDSRELALVAGRHGVAIVPGSVMSVRSCFDDFVRLPMSGTGSELSEGVARLARAWDSYERALKGGTRQLEVVV